MNIEPGPSDDRTRYDANEQQRQHPSGMVIPPEMWRNAPSGTARPVQLNEPPIGTVVSFKVQHQPGGKTYDYAAVRAGDGKWYTTGSHALQSVDWETFSWSVAERIYGPLVIMQPGQSYYF